MRIFLESDTNEPIYISSGELTAYLQAWWVFNDVIRSDIISNEKEIIIIVYDDSQEIIRFKKKIKDFVNFYEFDHIDEKLPNLFFFPFWEEIYENPEYTRTLDKKTGDKVTIKNIEDHCSVNIEELKQAAEEREKITIN